ncbi:hypothetical protein PIROE2DRAFT_5963 [Piromyces sp. E2]|nr:hypothetical protein PIROE2DRAFT_5963 [Piromyces sp. E2]|eukprot:OUM66751.1 hypothetical protein PIROE2DRAFT_5963 [Piromyces sp. E2]
MDSYDENSFMSLVDNINSKLLTSSLTINLKDGIYKVSSNNHLYLHDSLIFNGDKDTIFDFQKTRKTQFYFHFSAGVVDKKLIFNNITFTNFENFGSEVSNVMSFETEDTTDRYLVEFNNCIFLNNNGINNNIKLSCVKSVQKTPQFIYNNCKFM